MQVLAREGAWFDLATNGEVDLVRDAGIPATRCIHTHPIKRDSDIRHALDFGVTTFVVDNPDEIAKFVARRGRVRLLLRIAFRSPQAIVDLSRKFGCEPRGARPRRAGGPRAACESPGSRSTSARRSRSPDMYVRAIETCGR